MNSLSVDERLSALEKKIEALTSLINQQTQGALKSGNCNGGPHSQLNCRHEEKKIYEATSYIYQEIIQQLVDKERIYALLEEDIRECNLVFQNLKEDIQEPTLVKEKKNECVIEEEQKMERRQVEEHCLLIRIENVLVKIDKFNFLIALVILGKEENKQVVST